MQDLNGLIALQIRKYRKNKKMTLEDLSQATEIDETYLGRIERNEINITLNTLDKVIKGLDHDYASFFSFFDNIPQDNELYDLMGKIDVSQEKEKIIEILRMLVDITK